MMTYVAGGRHKVPAVQLPLGGQRAAPIGLNLNLMGPSLSGPPS